MKVTATPAQKALIVAAAATRHGVIHHRLNASAWQQKKMNQAMADAGTLVPGSGGITSQAVRAFAPQVLEDAHAAALADDLAAAPAPVTIADVKSGDIITYKTFSGRSEKWVTRRVRVIDPYIHRGRLQVKGMLVNRDGSHAKVQPRFGLFDVVEPHQLIAVQPGR